MCLVLKRMVRESKPAMTDIETDVTTGLSVLHFNGFLADLTHGQARALAGQLVDDLPVRDVGAGGRVRGTFFLSQARIEAVWQSQTSRTLDDSGYWFGGSSVGPVEYLPADAPEP